MTRGALSEGPLEEAGEGIEWEMDCWGIKHRGEVFEAFTGRKNAMLGTASSRTASLEDLYTQHEVRVKETAQKEHWITAKAKRTNTKREKTLVRRINAEEEVDDEAQCVT